MSKKPILPLRQKKHQWFVLEIDQIAIAIFFCTFHVS